MKHIFKRGGIFLLCLTLLAIGAVGLIGCNGPKSPSSADDGRITVVCTNFAGFDLTRGLLNNYRMVGGEGKVDLILLGKDGQDMHSYEPTAADIITISSADILVSVGAEQWLDASVQSSGNQDLIRVSMMAVCDPIEGDHDHDHGHDDRHDDGHSDDSCALIGTDEHVWLSVKNAILISQAIEDALCQVDADHAYAWESCGEAYRGELTALWGDYTAMMEQAVRDTVVIADRYPFAYLFRDLGLNCVAAFPGCSSETSASFATQTLLIEKTKELMLPYILIMEGSDGKVAATVAAETGAEVLTLNSMQVVTDRESTYIEIMRQNLENLKKALQ